jgi:hypothetical protein
MNGPSSYQPAPIDTATVRLPSEIAVLVERLAKNAHDLWAQQRLRDDWRFGPRRDDTKKENPCLVPHEDLPESEKVYDRQAAMETIKAILALGYRIDKDN